MELAEPSIETAYRNCVNKGADFIVIWLFFLLQVLTQDIPNIASNAAKNFPNTTNR